MRTGWSCRCALLFVVLSARALGAQVLARSFLPANAGGGEAANLSVLAHLSAQPTGKAARLTILAYARAHPSEVRGLIAAGLHDPAVVLGACNGNTADSACSAVALLARYAIDTTDAPSVVYLAAEEVDSMRALARYGVGVDLVGLSTSPMVSAFAAGAIRGVADKPDSGASTTLSGLLGIRVERPGRSILTGSINIASTQDAVTGDFGSHILLPFTGSGFSSGMLDVRLARTLLTSSRGTGWWSTGASWLVRHAPNHYYVGVSNGRWKIGDSTFTVSTVALGALWSTDLYTGTLQGHFLTFTTEGGIVWRGMNGDLAQPTEDQFRGDSLHFVHTGYFGPAFSLQLSLGPVVGSVDYYALNAMFYKSGRKPVPGLTGGQFAGGFRVEVPLLPGRDDK